MSQPLDVRALRLGLQRRLATPLASPVLMGAVLTNGDELFNSALMTDPDGFVCPTCRYDKQVLVPLVEQAPPELLSDALHRLVPAPGRFKVGEHSTTIALDGRKIGVAICYEALFPELASHATRAGAELLVQITNDGWLGRGGGPELHAALAKLRAVEQRRYVVRSATSGVSLIADPVGRELDRVGVGVARTMMSDVAWMSEGTLYARLGDRPFWALSLLAAIVLGARHVRRRQSSRDAPPPASRPS